MRTFELNDVEEAKANEWIKNHKCEGQENNTKINKQTTSSSF